jgi:SP family general alpha glucoside:H+ symporter-like MFS transporter
MSSHGIDETAAPGAKTAMDDEKDQYDQDQIDCLKAKDRVIASAKRATETEQNMTLMQGIRLYPKAIAFSVLISTCIVMEGYDVCLINNFCKFSNYFHPRNPQH